MASAQMSSVKPALSVVICTHNPKRQYLNQVIEALKSQTLSKEQWELLLIDNASTQSLASEIYLDWHPTSRCVREEKLGTLYARLRGIQEAEAELIVFVDDDNVLEKDYLEIALKISNNWPMLGAWGGQCIPNFEEEPPAWTKQFWELLAIREFERDRWSNIGYNWEVTPVTAGGCYRKIVAKKHLNLACNDQKRLKLYQKGKLLLRCEDIDLAWSAFDLGLGLGLFTSLKLHHLMPSSRFEEEYILRLIEDTQFSNMLLFYVRGFIGSIKPWKLKLQSSMPWLLNPKVYFASPSERRFAQASTRGILKAKKEILEISGTKALS